MESRASILIACLLVASAAGAETVYKYRGVDGKTTYTTAVPNAELIEALDYKFASPAARGALAATSDAAGEKRLRDRLAELDRSRTEVQDATRALAIAETRLAAGVPPRDVEGNRIAALEADVTAARARLEIAQRNYNQVR